MKIPMSVRKTKIILALLTFGMLITCLLLSPTEGRASAKGPFPGFSGAPGEETCRHCHTTFPINQAGGELRIDGFPEFYTPGEIYSVTVTLSSNIATRWGFQATSLSEKKKPAGKPIATDKSVTKVVNGIFFPERVYIEQKNAGTYKNQTGSVSWEFDWMAPKRNKGPVTLYVSGNAGNGDGDKTGDRIYFVEAVAQPAP